MKLYLIFTSSSLGLKHSSLILNRIKRRGMTAFLLRLIEWSWQQQQQLGVKGLWKGKEEGREMSHGVWVLGSRANVADKNVTGKKGDDEEKPFIFQVILSNSSWWLGLGAELSFLLYRFLLSQAEEKWLSPAMSERIPAQGAAGGRTGRLLKLLLLFN